MHIDLNTVILVLGFIVTIGSNKLDVASLQTRIDALSTKLDAISKVVKGA